MQDPAFAPSTAEAEAGLQPLCALLLLFAAAQSCPTLGDPVVCSLPGSSAHAISPTRMLEWAAMSLLLITVPTAQVCSYL